MATNGMCECGCGQKTKRARQTDRAKGHVKGEPMRFILNHHRRRAGFPDGVLVDDVDRDLGKLAWNLNPPHNSVRTKDHIVRIENWDQYLHRMIAARMIGRPLGEDEDVDHINGNPMDNRRSNLRVVSHAVNMQNRTRPHARNTSGYRGVTWHKNKWEAVAKVGLKDHYIGSFSDPHKAAEALHEWRLKNMPGYTPELYEQEKARAVGVR